MRKNLLIPAILLALPTFAVAQDFNDLAKFELLSGWRNADGTHVAAVQITLKPGWITYWRAPGEAGIPPQFSFSSASDITSITPHWPVPDVYDDAGLRSIGYYDSVVFPLIVDAEGVTGDISLSGELVVGVCDEICVPVTFSFDTLLPAKGQSDASIATALSDQALTKENANVGDVTCQIDPISDGLRLTAAIDVAQENASEFVVVEPSDPRIWVSQADIARVGDTLTATVEMVHPSGEPFAFDRSGVRITVLGNDGYAVDLLGCSAD